MQSFGFEGGLQPFSSTDPYKSTFSAVNEFQRNSGEFSSSYSTLLDFKIHALVKAVELTSAFDKSIMGVAY